MDAGAEHFLIPKLESRGVKQEAIVGLHHINVVVDASAGGHALQADERTGDLPDSPETGPEDPPIVSPAQ